MSTKSSSSGVGGKIAAENDKTGAPVAQEGTQPAPACVRARKSPRRVKVREDVDTDYAEEAEDFFYGEGR